MAEPVQNLIVATPRAVAASIRELRKHKIHPHFAGYLCVLRAAARLGKQQDIKVNFKNFFDEFLAYGDASKKHPYVVPFLTANRTNGIWFNKNVAGSYAPGSFRQGHAFTQVISVIGNRADARYTLPQGHASAALKYFLYDQKLPVIPLAMFLYRDYGLEMAEQGADNHEVFVAEFRSEFGLGSQRDRLEIFDELFEINPSYLQGLPVTQHFDLRGQYFDIDGTR